MESSENEYLKELSPKLFETKVKRTDAAPDGYFDDLPEKVMANIDAIEGHQTISGARINWRNLGIAAGLAIAIGAVQFFKPFGESSPDQSASADLTEISTEEIETYLEESDIYEIYVLEDAEATAITANPEDDEITDYLLAEGVSNELLYEAMLN
ncbi:MAG TPA: hypothetical protein VJ911_06505 [Cryomorphaceae bacterium]|nr:hypothetical protein [Cryomorphaceae bacterium]